MAQTLALVDTNALSYLARPPKGAASDTRAQDALRAAVDSRVLHVLVHPALLAEVVPTALSDHGLAEKMLQLACDLGSGLVLHQRPYCGRIEAESGRACDAWDVTDWRGSAAFWRSLNEGHIDVKEVANPNRIEGRRHMAWHEMKRAEVQEEFGVGKHAGKALDAWFSGFEAVVASWGNAIISNDSQLGRLRDRPTLIAEVPTLRATVEFTVAQIYRILRSGVSTGPKGQGDFFDCAQYSAAVHADLLVTDDRRFRDIVSLIPTRKPMLLSTEEFVHRFS